MILFLGGLPGSGRKALANKLSAQYNVYHYELERFMPGTYVLNPHQELITKTRYPTSDVLMLRVYEKAAAEFPMLSKLHEHVVIDGTFHREKIRQYIFREAQKYFGSIAIIWIDRNSTPLSQKRLGKHSQKMVRTRIRIRSRFEAFPYPIARFTCNDSDPDVARNVWQLALADATHKKPL
jgi:hypothetical protein